MKRNLVVIFAVLVLSGCARNVFVIPRAENQYEVVAYSAEESAALSKALKKAQKTCAKNNQNYLVQDKSVTYHGVLTKEANKLSKNLAGYLTAVTDTFVPTASTDEDYKATLKIECVPQQKV